MKRVTIFILVLFALASCTDNDRARSFGGSETVKIDPNERFVNITWKGNSMWIITEDTRTGIYYAREKSAYGVLEGEIIVTK